MLDFEHIASHAQIMILLSFTKQLSGPSGYSVL